MNIQSQLELSLEFTSQSNVLNTPNVLAAHCLILQWLTYRSEVEFIGVVS